MPPNIPVKELRCIKDNTDWIIYDWGSFIPILIKMMIRPGFICTSLSYFIDSLFFWSIFFDGTVFLSLLLVFKYYRAKIESNSLWKTKTLRLLFELLFYMSRRIKAVYDGVNQDPAPLW